MEIKARPEFATEAEASEWMYEEIKDEDCVDGYRFAFEDDAEAMAKYDDIYNHGCCGYFDADIIVAGRLAVIGCNYGH